LLKVAYSVAGEGRGHASRARTVGARLLDRGHEVAFLTGGDAMGLLREGFGDDPRARFIEIPTPRFVYRKKGSGESVSLARSVWGFLKLAKRIPNEARRVEALLRAGGFEPDIIVVDYEPLGYRVAKRFGAPVVALDNQHYFAHARLSGVDFRSWPYFIGIGLSCRAFCPRKEATLISKCIAPETLRASSKAIAIGPLIRPEISGRRAEVVAEDFLLAYLRPAVAERALAEIGRTGMRTLVYGLGDRPSEGRIEFRPVSLKAFAEDLVRCRGVVATAGNQMVSEALFLRKPLLLYPEPGQIEQRINAQLAEKLGAIVTGEDRRGAWESFLRFERPPDPGWDRDAAALAVRILEAVAARRDPASVGDFESAPAAKP
jgi:uncharacterized protein (TIGR00661 family)